MFTAKPELNAMDRERARVERLKARNEDRAKRLLNAKLRIYGRDTEALEEQSRVKAEHSRIEKERELAYDQKRMEDAKMLAQLEKEKEEQRKLDAYQLAQFHKEQQRLKDMRDQEEMAHRRSDGGPAVKNQDTLFLKFHGEDLGKSTRQKMQKEQQRDWIIQQMREKEAAKKAEEGMNARYVAFTNTVGGTCEAAEKEKQIDKVTRNLEIQEYNRQLMMAKKHKERQRKLEDLKVSEEELKATYSSKLLREDINDTYATGNPNRRLPYHFKGFTAEENQAILDQQANQIAMKREKLERQRANQQEYESVQENYRRKLVLLEREKIAEQNREAQKLAQFHEKQKIEKNMQNKNLIRAVYQNPVSPEFFDQFGKSCR